MRITKEQVIACIHHFVDLRYKVDIVRTYCLEKGKEEFATEMFLQACRDHNTKLQMLYLSGQLPEEPQDIFTELALDVIREKVIEFGIVYVYSKSGKLIKIY